MARTYKRDAKGRFAGSGGGRVKAARSKLRKRSSARHKRKASMYRARAKERTASNRRYIRETGDRGTQADTNRLRKRNRKDKARAAKHDRKARR